MVKSYIRQNKANGKTIIKKVFVIVALMIVKPKENIMPKNPNIIKNIIKTVTMGLSPFKTLEPFQISVIVFKKDSVSPSSCL